MIQSKKGEHMDFIIYFCICVIAVTIFALYIRKVVKQQKQREEEKGTPTAEVNEIKTEFKTIAVQAEVVDLSCRVEMVGTKTPKTVTVFTATFQTNNNEIIKVDVPQEMYDGLEKGQRGELTLAEGELYSFII